MRSILIAGLGGFFLGGCASGVKVEPEQLTALAVQQRVAVLRAEIRSKIDAEERYYRDTVDSLTTLRERSRYTESRREAIGRALRKAEELRKKPAGLDLGQLSAEMAGRAEATGQALVTGIEEQKKYRESIEKSVQALDHLNNQYSALERTLVQLSQPADMKISDVARFIQDTVKHYKQLEKSEDDQEGPEDAPSSDTTDAEQPDPEADAGRDGESD